MAWMQRSAIRASDMIFKHGLIISANRLISYILQRIADNMLSYSLSAMILMSFAVFINLISSDL